MAEVVRIFEFLAFTLVVLLGYRLSTGKLESRRRGLPSQNILSYELVHAEQDLLI
jgi:hypothetical protein